MNEYEKGILNLAHAFTQTEEYKHFFGAAAEQEVDAPHKHTLEKLMCAECHEWFTPQDILPNGTCNGCYAQERIINIE